MELIVLNPEQIENNLMSESLLFTKSSYLTLDRLKLRLSLQLKEKNKYVKTCGFEVSNIKYNVDSIDISFSFLSFLDEKNELNVCFDFTVVIEKNNVDIAFLCIESKLDQQSNIRYFVVQQVNDDEIRTFMQYNNAFKDVLFPVFCNASLNVSYYNQSFSNFDVNKIINKYTFMRIYTDEGIRVSPGVSAL